MQLKNLLKVILVAFFPFFALTASAQNRTITGKVTDFKDNSPLIGVSVVATGSTQGTVTDANGTYTLTVPLQTTSLTFTYIGYTRKQVTVTGNVMNVTMDNASNSLNEVLVVGYGTVRKKDATGAVQKVSSSDFVQGVTTNPLQQLQGKAAGVDITTTSGDPNSSPTVRIRGTVSLSGGNDPLYVIDGVEGADIRSVSPNDIESFDILKDASASAIYGSRAAGGVILVTTKTGKAGRVQTSVNVYGATESPEHLVKFADRSQYLADYLNFYGKAMPQGTSNTSDQGANTNWFDLITHTGITQNENLAISGGGEKSHYRASVTYYDQQGDVRTSFRKDINARFNADQRTLNDKLLITFNLSASHTNAAFVDGNSVFLNAASVPSVISPFNVVPTAYDYTNPNNYQLINNTQEANPLPNLYYTKNTASQDRMTGNLHFDYSLTKQITLSPYINAIHYTGSQLIYYPPTQLISPIADFNNPLMGNVPPNFSYTPQLTNQGDIDQGFSAGTNATVGGTAAYKGVFGKSRLNVLAGAERFSDYYSGTRTGVHNLTGIEGLPNENTSGANSISNLDVASFTQGYVLNSIFGRVEYNFADKYYFTGNARYDNSNKLGFNNQGQVFPSGSVAWTMSNEDFLKDVRWISSLKLRAGYGQVGDQEAITPYGSQQLFGPTANLYYDGASQSWLAAPFVVQNPNSDLRWEVNTTTDIGVDFSLFNGRLNGTLDVYNKKTTHLLYNYTVPVGGQYYTSQLLANVGTLQNRGLEFNLNGKILQGHALTWTSGINFSLNRNKIVTLSGTFNNTQFTTTQANVGSTGGTGISGAISQIGYLKVGYPVGTLLLPQYAGINSKGQQLFYKYAANGTRDTTSNISNLNLADDGSTQDRKFYSTEAKFTYSWTNSFTYKAFDFNLFLRGSYGGKGYNEVYQDYTSLAKVGTYAVLADASKYGIKSSSEPSTFWLQSTSYLKVQSATLGYTFKIADNKYVDRLHIYAAGNNLYTFTPYKGLDPELNTSGGLTGIDARQLYYPRAREVSLGLSLTLK